MPDGIVASTIRDSNQKLNTLRVKVTQLLTLTLSSPSMTSFLNGKPIPQVPSLASPPPALATKADKEPKTTPGGSAGKSKQKAAGRNFKTEETSAHTRNPLSADKVQQVNGVPTKNPAPSPNPQSDPSILPTAPVADAAKTDSTEHKQRPVRGHANSANVVVEPSADDPDYVAPHNAAGGAKKGKKKKKKSAMANAANPHHVKNCKPERDNTV